MFKALSILAFIALAITASSAQEDAKDKELVSFYAGLYEKTPQDCPERFAVNKIGEKSWHARAFATLNGKTEAPEGAKDYARKELSDLRELILLGQNWPIKEHERKSIPYAKLKPSLDGDIDSPAWKQALVFDNEYNLNSTEETASSAKWLIMWDEEFLYIAARLPDSSIKSYEYIPGAKPQPWEGDCLEMFVMPSMRLKTYWEVVVNPEGKVFDGLHRNNKNGGFIGCPEEDMAGLKTYAKILHDESGGESGFVIEAALPFKELPGYMLGNKPEPGQGLYFMMVRTNDGKKSSPRPFLYDGHNIFGYMDGTLVK